MLNLSLGRMKVRLVHLLLFLVAMGIAGCAPCFVGNQITVPPSDSTPPTVSMDVHFPRKPSITVTSTSLPADSKVGGNDVVTLIAGGNDSEGVEDIRIWVEETRWFANPLTGVTTQKGPGLLGAPEASNPNNLGSGQACTARTTSVNIDVQARLGGATSYMVRAWAEAENIAGDKVITQVVTLNWP